VTVLVACPADSDDEARDVLEWMAQANQSVIGRAQLSIQPEDWTGIEALLRQTTDGLIFVGHGSETAALGRQKQPVLDAENVSLVQDRWVHSIACLTGMRLAWQAVDTGTTCFVGYEHRLVPEFEPATLQPAVRSALHRLVTSTSVLLNGGETEPTAIAQAADVARRAIPLTASFEHMKLAMFANQLARPRVVSRHMERVIDSGTEPETRETTG